MVGIPAKNVGTTDKEFKPYGIAPGSDTKLDWWVTFKMTSFQVLEILL